MKGIGIALWLAGTTLFLYATFVFEASISTYSSAYLPDRVVNLDLQQRQLLLAMAGLALFLAGVIVHALGELAEARALDPEAQAAPPQEAPAPPAHRGPESQADAELMAQHGIRPGDAGTQV